MKRQLATEWIKNEFSKLYEQFKNNTVSFSLYQIRIKQIIEESKQKELDNLDKSYTHGSFSLLDTGHGDTYEQYIKETYGIDK